MAGLGALIFGGIVPWTADQVLSQWRPATDVTLQPHGISRIGVAQGAHASFDGFAKQVHFWEPRGEIDVLLPTPRSECQHIANQLQGRCDQSGVTIAPPVDAIWDRARELTLDEHQARAATLTESQGEIGFEITGGGSLSVCLIRGTPDAKLVLRSPASDLVVIPSSLGQGCQSNLMIRIKSINSADESSFLADGLLSGEAKLTGSHLTGCASHVTVTLLGQQPNLDLNCRFASSRMELDAEKVFTVVTDVEPQDTTVLDGSVAASTTTLTVNGTELIPNAWDRNPTLIGVISAVLGAAIAGVLVYFLTTWIANG